MVGVLGSVGIINRGVVGGVDGTAVGVALWRSIRISPSFDLGVEVAVVARRGLAVATSGLVGCGVVVARCGAVVARCGVVVARCGLAVARCGVLVATSGLVVAASVVAAATSGVAGDEAASFGLVVDEGVKSGLTDEEVDAATAGVDGAD